MPAFTTSYSRKPWNKVVEWLYAEASVVASQAETLGIKSIEDFRNELQGRLDQYGHIGGRSNPTLQRTKSLIDIKTWIDRYCGIDKVNSVNGSAFTIKMEA